MKTSLAPGSQVVADYLEAAGLQEDLDALGYNLVAFGCTSCLGNSGPLDEPVSKAIDDGNLVACAVLSGNRNFEGRVHRRHERITWPLRHSLLLMPLPFHEHRYV